MLSSNLTSNQVKQNTILINPEFENLASQDEVIQDFTIYLWLAVLSAIGFAGASFGFFGWAMALVVFLLGFIANIITLSMAFKVRDEKDALKKISEGIGVAGILALLGFVFSAGLIVGLIAMLFFLQLALNVVFREHRQVYFGLLIAFIALMAGAVNTFSSSYLIFMLAFCLMTCFYMAQVFVDKQRYVYANHSNDMLDMETSHLAHSDASNKTVLNKASLPALTINNSVQYVGDWRYGKRIVLAVLISLLAGLIYLITPHFPAGNLGRMPLEGFGLYENKSLEDQILPETADLSDKFYDESDVLSQGNNRRRSDENSDNNNNKVNSNNKDNDSSDQNTSTSAKNKIGTGQDSAQSNELQQQSRQNNPNGTPVSSPNGEAIEGSGEDSDSSSESQSKSQSQSGSGDSPFPSMGMGGQESENGIPSGSATSLDDSIHYYVKSDQSRYLQHETQTYFDGRSWLSLQYGWKKVPNDYFDYTLYDVEPNNSIDIVVAKAGNRHLLTTNNTVALSFANSWVATNYYDQLKVGEPLQEETQYQLKVVDDFKQNRQIDPHQAKPDDKDLQLPDNIDPRVAELNASIVRGITNDWDKAIALESHFRHNYEYTLDTISRQNDIPLTDFLFGAKRGHCEYFATAMAVMLRQQGIPARMVSGYVANDYNPVTGFYEVKGTNGHAWVEAYIDGDWVLYEATGAYGVPSQNSEASEQATRSEGSASQGQSTYERLEEYLEELTTQDEMLEQAIAEMTLLERLKMTLHALWYGFILAIASLIEFVKRYIWVIVLALVMIVVAVKAGFWLYRRYHIGIRDKIDFYHLKRLSITHDKSSLHQALSLYQRMLRRHGIDRGQGMTIENFSQELLQLKLIDAQQAQQLIDTINQTFYATQDGRSQNVDNKTQPAIDLNALFMNLYRQGVQRYQ